jgi:hypothetical protein
MRKYWRWKKGGGGHSVSARGLTSGNGNEIVEPRIILELEGGEIGVLE